MELGGVRPFQNPGKQKSSMVLVHIVFRFWKTVHVWRKNFSKQLMENCWKKFAICLEIIWEKFEKHFENVWENCWKNVWENCLENVWEKFGICLRKVWNMFGKRFGKCSGNVWEKFEKHLENVWENCWKNVWKFLRKRWWFSDLNKIYYS